MKLISLTCCLLAVWLLATGCVAHYDCTRQAGEDPISYDACLQLKGSLSFHYCVDNPRYKSFAECAKDATKPGADACLTRFVSRPAAYDCLSGKGPALVSEAVRKWQKPLPELKLSPDPEPPKGSAMFVTGVVLTSALPALGLGGWAYAKSLDCSEEEDKKDVEACEDTKKAGPQIAVVYTTLGLGIGLPLLVNGWEQKQAHRSWLDRQGGSATRLGWRILPLAKGGALATLTWTLD